jgi:rifampicin phosphotransferase
MKKYIFDNSNLAESYSGVTTPLTFSFARYVYQEVYKSFCDMMGVSPKVIEKNKDMFPNMVVFIGYRMYYDLINWYRLVSFLPGYKFNRRFLEKMLGVEKQHDHSSDTRYNFWQRYFIDFPLLIWQFIKIVFNFIFMGHLVKNFNKNFDKTYLQSDKLDLKNKSSLKLREIYLSLTTDLTSRWKVPIANDLAVMVSTGIADTLVAKWLKDESVYNYLRLSSQKSLVSLDPGLEIARIIKNIRDDGELLELFKNQEALFVWQSLKTDHSKNSVSLAIFDYLKNFGSRSPSELKLEAITLKEDPRSFIIFLQNNLSDNIHQENKNKEVRESRAFKDLFIIKKGILNFILKWARNSIDRREETRFKRTLIFGFSRKVFLQIGANLKNEGILNKQRDIFYLEVEQIFSVLDGEITKDKIQEIINKKKEEIELWQEIDLPRRIETNKLIKELELELKSVQIDNKKITNLKGVVASQTKECLVEGRALLMPNFDNKANFNNKILIARQTDPGWTMVFPLVKALVIERGGMLSHAAIVARELGIPCIIGVEGAISCIKDDSLIKLDLSTGKIMYE